MYGLYDREGILRFINADKKACLDYAELFELNSAHFCVVSLFDSINKKNNISLNQNQVEYNN